MLFSQININGIITFKNPLPSFSTDTLPIASTPFVAPYWADVDIRDFGAISFRQLSWAGSDDAILDQVNEIIRSSFVDQRRFSADWILMVSWNKVGFNSQIDSTRVSYSLSSRLILTQPPKVTIRRVTFVCTNKIDNHIVLTYSHIVLHYSVKKIIKKTSAYPGYTNDTTIRQTDT